MTAKPLMPDLKERLKDMIIGFIKEHKDEDTYKYRILSKFEYLTRGVGGPICKVTDQSGKIKYYHYFREVEPLKGVGAAVNKLKDGDILSWKQLNALFSGCKRKEFIYSNIKKEYYYEDMEYHHIYPSLEDPDFLDEILQKAVYELEGSHIVRNLIRLDKVIGCDLARFSFTGLEKGAEIPIKVLVFIPNEEEYSYSMKFSIAPDYINHALQKIKATRRYYKDEGYYKNKKTVSFKFDNSLMQIGCYEINMKKDCYLSDEFVDSLSHFIYGADTHILEIETKKNKSRIEEEVATAFLMNSELYDKETMYAFFNHYYDNCAKGLKIYKIPQPPFDWTLHLKKIKAKLAQFKEAGMCIENHIKEYTLFTKYDISFEYSPDNYFEIYGTQEALALFFLPRTNEELVGFEMVCDCLDEKNVHIVDHFYPEVGEGLFAAIYAHHFGSVKNRIETNIDLTFCYLME
ncbi:O-methyltransferase [Mycoavidus cysteinexigens]|uniref:O-methyltransferase n=1 Tax=Mycoavidus cysteinexigens TaxID=1553431 RepID=A0A2Z6ETG5_9BURK|nr:hypothetical protein [Mycoavidus cysteinexigens]BBE08690.1 O-methyltransferase [Mycoavidus cysteinexigens]GAM52601.1 hypothetical protein EBME_1064 [bacterium endosymbiont of Mortierella elongata FMR23-6]GLR01448.1 hypothetical protein GCM10007934_12600 [Mycoavidus cysteinexigens]